MKVKRRRSLLKTIGLTVGALLVLPLSITAATSTKLSVEDGAKLIMNRDVNRPVLSGVTLSMDAQMYNNDQAITDELKKINDAHTYYNDRQSEYRFEATTYQQLYQYWYLLQAQKVTNKSVDLSKEQLRVAQARYNQGVISEGQLLQVEMSVNEALVAKEEMDRNVDQLRYKLNLDLGRNVDQELEITLNQFKTIERSKLDKKKMTDQVTQNHDSLYPLRQAVTAYGNVLSKIDSINFLIDLKRQLKQAEERVVALTPINGDTIGQILYEEAKATYQQLDLAYQKAVQDLNDIKADLKSYYRNQRDAAEKQLEQTKRHLEWVVHTSVDELRQLEKAIDRYEDNVKKAEKLYKQAKARFDAGLTTPVHLDEARLALQNAELTLAGAKQSYLNAKTEYLLFLDGYLPTGAAGMP